MAESIRKAVERSMLSRPVEGELRVSWVGPHAAACTFTAQRVRLDQAEAIAAEVVRASRGAMQPRVEFAPDLRSTLDDVRMRGLDLFAPPQSIVGFKEKRSPPVPAAVEVEVDATVIPPEQVALLLLEEERRRERDFFFGPSPGNR